jgi:hypothetical protein
MPPGEPRSGHGADANNAHGDEDKLSLQSQSAYMHVILEFELTCAEGLFNRV